MKLKLKVGTNALELEGSPVVLEIEGKEVYRGEDAPAPQAPPVDYSKVIAFPRPDLLDDEYFRWVQLQLMAGSLDPRWSWAEVARLSGRPDPGWDKPNSSSSGPGPSKTGTNLDLGRRENQHYALQPITYTFTLTKPQTISLRFAPMSGQGGFDYFGQWLRGPGINEVQPMKPDSVIDDKFARTATLQAGTFNWTIVLDKDCRLGVEKSP